MSRTALGVCGYTALLTRHIQLSSVFYDPFASVLFAAAAEEGADVLAACPDWDAVLAAGPEPGNSRLIAQMAWRKRWVQDKVRAHLDAGVRQVVILGSGLDTTALRMIPVFPDTVFYEVDQVETLRAKADLVHARFGPLPAERYTAVDFATDDIETRLLAAGYDAAAPTVFVAEASLEYAPREEVVDTWRMIRRNGNSGTAFVTTFVRPSDGAFNADINRTIAQLQGAGEPLLFSPTTEEIHALCTAEGFEIADWMSGGDVLTYLEGFGVAREDLPYEWERQLTHTLTMTELRFADGAPPGATPPSLRVDG
ncbi:MAG: class I SAM-dependent methyltransferase [Actinomycetota bacterium]